MGEGFALRAGYGRKFANTKENREWVNNLRYGDSDAPVDDDAFYDLLFPDDQDGDALYIAVRAPIRSDHSDEVCGFSSRSNGPLDNFGGLTFGEARTAFREWINKLEDKAGNAATKWEKIKKKLPDLPPGEDGPIFSATYY